MPGGARLLRGHTFRESGLVWAIAEAELIEQTRKENGAEEKDHDARSDIDGRQRQRTTAGEEWKQRLRNLIKASRHALRRQFDATFQEAGEKVAGHGCASH